MAGRLIGLIRVLVAAIIIAAIGLILLLQAYINPIVQGIFYQQAKSFFGESLQLGGVDIEVWRGSLLLRDVKLRQPYGFGGGNLLEAPEVRIGLALLPLLQNKLELTSVKLIDPDINLVQMSDGRFNIDTIFAKLSKGQPFHGGGAAIAPVQVSLRRFSFTGGRISLISYPLTMREPALLITESSLNLTDLNFPNSYYANSRFNLRGMLTVGQKSPIRVDGSGLFGAGPVNFNARTRIDGMEMADYLYLFPPSTVEVRSGRVWLRAETSCVKDYVNSLQHAEVKDLKVHARGGIIGAILVGLPAKAFVKVIDDRRGRLNFDFKIEGTINSLRVNLKGTMSKAIGASLQSKFNLKEEEPAADDAAQDVKETGKKAIQKFKGLF